MTKKSLSEMKPKEKGEITKVTGSGGIFRRILDMGVISGTEVEVQRIAPLGDPIEIRIKGYSLTLRKNEAANIKVDTKER